MPLLSIVVVTWNNENYIEQALRSCNFPDTDDYEVIVVDNGSVDRTPEVLRRVTDKRPDLFKIVRNETNEGPGVARNIGMRHATGDFIMFLDGDDWLDDKASERIFPLIQDTAYDVIVFNHARAYDTGGIWKNAKTKLLWERDCSAVEERLKVAGNFNVAWNKVYKRSFLEKNKVTFPPRIYEDVDWHFKVLVLAETYYVIPDVLVYYRQRSGSVLRSESDMHFDAIWQYEGVLRFLKEDPERFNVYGRMAYYHARELMLNLILNQRRLPRSSEPEYLRQMTALLTQWRAELGQRESGVMLSVARLNSGGVLRGVNELRKSIVSVKASWKRFKAKVMGSKIVKRTNAKLKLTAFNAFSRLPLKDNLVLCESFWGAKADCNPMAIAQELKRRGGYEVAWSLSPKAPTDEDSFAGFRRVRRGGYAFLYALARAKYLINNANFPTEYEKREGQISVQTKHGTPLKSMGLDIRKRRPKEMNWGTFAQRCRRWDYVISSNPYSSAVWRQGFPYSYKMLEIGYPRNDMFFTSTPEMVSEIKAKLGIPEGKKVALYAPTYRDSAKGGNLAISEAVFDPALISEALGPDYVLLMRAHYFNKPGAQHANVIDVSSYPYSNDVVLVSDLLITDYSSIMFDYGCLKRPIVLYQYDMAAYTKSRGTYMDLHDMPPGAIVETQEELLYVLETKHFESEHSNAQLAKFNAEFCPWDDGQASARFLTEVLGLAAE